MVRVGVLVPFGVFVPTRVLVGVAVSIAVLAIVAAPSPTTASASTGSGDNASTSSTGTLRAIAWVTRSAYYDSVWGAKRQTPLAAAARDAIPSEVLSPDERGTPLARENWGPAWYSHVAEGG
jgi:hypothetical protein